MADRPVLYGFDGSTYVRTLRCVLKVKGIAYDQVPVNVLAGEPRSPEHLARHPFGKVPVLDIDGRRIRETSAICRYLEETRPEPPVMPDMPGDRARMNEAISLTDSYGYAALVGVAGYHLFPDFIGGKDETARERALAAAGIYMRTIAELKGDDDWIAGERPGLADYFLGPILFYVMLTGDGTRVLSDPGMRAWWDRLSADAPFAATEPDLG